MQLIIFIYLFEETHVQNVFTVTTRKAQYGLKYSLYRKQFVYRVDSSDNVIINDKHSELRVNTISER
jgi:hypothetical protein